MCYEAVGAEARLAKSVDLIHFDEAWYGYARFNPMYRDRFAMRGDPASHANDAPTLFATHSTHKLLTALSQTSFFHIRDGRGAMGGFQGILIDPRSGVLMGGSDPRKDGLAIGW